MVPDLPGQELHDKRGVGQFGTAGLAVLLALLHCWRSDEPGRMAEPCGCAAARNLPARRSMLCVEIARFLEVPCPIIPPCAKRSA